MRRAVCGMVTGITLIEERKCSVIEVKSRSQFIGQEAATAWLFNAFTGLAVVSKDIHGGIMTGDVRGHGSGLCVSVVSTLFLVGYPVKITVKPAIAVPRQFRGRCTSRLYSCCSEGVSECSTDTTRIIFIEPDHLAL